MQTTRPIATCERFDVVVVPFPFTDRATSKRRPALVLSSHPSFNVPSGHSILAMITSATHSTWPLDVRVTDMGAAGLSAPSIVRMKLFTLDNEFVLRKAGHLAEADKRAVRAALAALLTNGN